MELAPGTILLDKYRIEALIGSGGMGNVVRASHLYLHQPVAIKLLLPEMAASSSTVQRFLREAQATVKLRSEHIARVMDVGTTPQGVPFMVMEFLDGNDLNQILRHHGPQPPAIVVDLMLQACEGIAEAHALGIIHRDIKPSNFFVTRRPDGSMLLKILDFGISKTPVGYDELTGTQTVLGTPSYMAPEQMKSGRSADPRSDIWSIGVVMYQLLTGRLPFAGESYAELVLKVGLEPPLPLLMPLPPGLGEVLMRCLEKEPAARHQTVSDLARLLAPYASDPVAATQSATRAQRILQQRGTQQGLPGAAMGPAGLATPLSPAQLTPRSWPPSQMTSLSQGAGQVTSQTQVTRGWLIAGVAGLCVLAAGSGYAISQLSKPEPASRGPHVQAPLPRTTEPAPGTSPSGAAATGAATTGAAMTGGAAASAPPGAAAATAPTGAAPAGTASPTGPSTAAPAVTAPSAAATASTPSASASSTAPSPPTAAPGSPATTAPAGAAAAAPTAGATRSPATTAPAGAAATTAPAGAAAAGATRTPTTAPSTGAAATTAGAMRPPATIAPTGAATPTAGATRTPATAPSTGAAATTAGATRPPATAAPTGPATPTAGATRPPATTAPAGAAATTTRAPATAAPTGPATTATTRSPGAPTSTGSGSDGKRVGAQPADAKQPAPPAAADRPGRTAPAKPGDARPPSKPTKPARPKSDDLFDSRH